jgi:hypothetical protein
MRLVLPAFALSLAFAGVLPARALEAPVTVVGAWARATVPGQDSTGAYMSLTAREPLTLVGAETPAAGIVEMHEMRMEGDVMKMRAAEKLPLAPGKALRLAPNSYHFMLMDLKAPFKAGTRVAMTLRFRDAKGVMRTLPVNVPVSLAPPAAKH